ncbi:MAG TPA: hypothetical protein VEP90_00580 [Methylomirabilota bacterium]|nr:hypothetical protein [Methylomirabilota bacterium]
MSEYEAKIETPRVDFDPVLFAGVQRGALLLDQKCPDWAQKINIDALKIRDCYCCILGQLYRNYMLGKTALNIAVGTSIDYGFGALEKDVLKVEKMWIKEIQARL